MARVGMGAAAVTPHGDEVTTDTAAVGEVGTVTV